MVRDYQQFTFGPDVPVDDIMAQLMKAMNNMQKQNFDARPLPKDPTIFTFADDVTLKSEELWEGTCPICRPIVRDLSVFCRPQEATFQEQNAFVCWNVVFSKLASVLATAVPSERELADANDCQDEKHVEEVRDEKDETKQHEAEQSCPNQNVGKESVKSDSADDQDPTDRGSLCSFCAYFACLMFDDPTYSFSTSSQGIGAFGIDDCCCAVSMDESKRIEKVARKLTSYAEKYGPHAEIEFVVQPIDYDLEIQAFGKIRIQAYSHSPSIPQEDMRSILGMRREVVLEVYGVPGRYSGNLLSIRHWPISTEPRDWPRFGKLWASECLSNHKDCRPPVKGLLPSRVVEILDDDSVRVVSGADKPNEFYIALSYCWGGPQEFSLTTDTMAEKYESFDISDLPATLKDALKVTKEFEIRYIWIDSLCIIQDSAEDKQRELPRMAEYYKNSYVTIAASTVKCTIPFLTSNGLCLKHPESKIPKDLVPLGLLISLVIKAASQQDDGEERVGTKYTENVIDYLLVRKEHPYFLSMEPISKRGWTFQERVLSPRILFFGGKLVWQCHAAQESAGGVTYWDDDAPNIDLRALGRGLFNYQSRKNSNKASQIDDYSDKEEYSLWYRAVEEYTRRILSVPSDKLPAISALAQVFKEVTGEEYFAGIWRGDLLRGLMWSTYPTLNLVKPSVWRAPSWSWASHDNEVSYKWLPPPESIPIAQIITAESVPQSKLVPLGEIASGILEIEGPILEMPKELTISLMQKENELPKLEDTAESRYRQMHGLFSKNTATDAGCRDWQPPDGHIWLALLATPARSKTNTVQESNTSSVIEAHKARLEDNETDQGGASVTETNAGPSNNANIDTPSDRVQGFGGYTISGLVLGPASGDAGSSSLKYERLAVFTTVGVAIHDYKDLEKLKRTVVIV